ncbi:right-handed parallel beta-helix repeat-containing protein [Pseudomonas sp. EpS/L25]|uniref:right-handed parallel beta-helix repeat-containing protein n=1 Tax=Pseudomonas sp. EpS/L25 TaxID=1749078 RepID=UPI0009E7419B|nr:right-handed parallel beta-helix repeat-containing protein [Pseudomonas sp. EpS/L25]
MIHLIADGYTDCSAAINRMISLLPKGGGEIVLPPGDIFLRNTIRIENGPISVRGAGREVTRLIVDSPQGCAFEVGSPNGQVSRIDISNLSINTRKTLHGGAGIRLSRGYDVRISNCLIANMHCGIDAYDSSFLYITDCEILDPAAVTGIGILIHGNGIHNDQYLQRVFVQSRKQIAPCEVGVRIANSQGFWIDQCGIFHCKTGLHLLALDNMTLEHGFLCNNAIDNCVGHGILIDSGSSGTVRRIQSSGDWSCSNQGHGILANASGESSAVDDIKFIGTRLYGNGGDGVFIGRVSMISFDSCSIAGNGRDGVSSGISIQDACDMLAVRNSTIGAFSGYQNTQSYGLTGLENSKRAIIVGNAFEPNRQGAIKSRPQQAFIVNNLEV